jgi:flavin reductase ActVB
MGTSDETTPHGDAFRAAMARFPAGVTIVTTVDEKGSPHGFTASSFCSVSMDPPLVLVCLARSANSCPVFLRSRRFSVSILRAGHTEVARWFASAGVDKFGGGFTHEMNGLPTVVDALCVVVCTLQSRFDAGDHVILLGQAQAVDVGEGSPMVYYNQNFRRLMMAD